MHKSTVEKLCQMTKKLSKYINYLDKCLKKCYYMNDALCKKIKGGKLI